MKPLSPCLLVVVFVSVAFQGIDVVSGENATTQIKKSANERIGVQYARAYLRLTEIELKNAQNQNAKVRGVVSVVEIDRLRMNVAVARTQLQNALRPRDVNKMQVHLRYAETKLATAKTELQLALKSRKKNIRSVSAGEIERLKLVAEVAQYRLEMWRDPAYLPSLLDHMQWQIDRLSEEITQLHKRTQMLK